MIWEGHIGDVLRPAHEVPNHRVANGSLPIYDPKAMTTSLWAPGHDARQLRHR